MKIGDESHTALLTAYGRAYHARTAENPMFYDPLAESLLAPGTYEFLSTSIARLLPIYAPHLVESHLDEAAALAEVMRLIGWTTLFRSRFTEDHLAAAVKTGTSQYLMLGAGLDTFTFREPELTGKLRVFEVDHPTTQEYKLQRVEALGWTKPETVHYLPIDFTTQRMEDVLADSPFDPEATTFVSWLGVTYYLSTPSVFGTLKSLASFLAPGSAVVFDYFDADALDPDKASAHMRRMRTLVGRVGEPILSAFEPEKLARDLDEIGFELVEDLGPTDIMDRYFVSRSDGGGLPEHTHLARAICRG